MLCKFELLYFRPSAWLVVLAGYRVFRGPNNLVFPIVYYLWA